MTKKANSLSDSGMEKTAPLPVPTHNLPLITDRAEIWRGERDRNALPGRKKNNIDIYFSSAAKNT